MDITYLNRCFVIPKESKTLKLKKKDGFTPEECSRDAASFLRANSEFTRIEFKCGDMYYVVARLKE